MEADLLIKNGQLYDPGGGICRPGDLAVSGGRIISTQAGPYVRAAQALDAAGCLVLPGLIDLHTHVSRFPPTSG